LLLLDEPLASLDGARKREILPYLVRLRDEGGIPMIYVSHHAPELRRIATAVVLLEGGRVAACGGLDVLTAATAELMMPGRPRPNGCPMAAAKALGWRRAGCVRRPRGQFREPD